MQAAELVAIQGDSMRFIIQPRPPDVGGRRMLQKLFLNRVLVEPSDGAQPPGDGGARSPSCFQVAGEAFDVGGGPRTG